MNVQNLKLQFSNQDNRSSNVVRTQIPVSRFGFGHRSSIPSSLNSSTDNLMNGNPHHNNSPHSFHHTHHSQQYSPQHSPIYTSTTSLPVPLSPDKWKAKYDDVEKKRKTLLSQNQKITRDNEDLQRRYSQVFRELETTKRELVDKDIKLNQLRKLSEAVYKEYDQLKNQYELETGTMQKAMQRASQWYKQNRELKRRSTALMQRVMQVAPDTMTDLADDTDSGISTDTDDFDELRRSVQELNHDVARLQAEVNAVRLQEFEAQETIVDLTSQLEDERNTRTLLESELQELRSMRENLGQVSRLVAAEVSSLRHQCEREKETAQRMKEDADKAKKERNVLAHQSQLLMCEVAADQRLLQVVMEVENLKRTLEEEQQRHAAELQTLQEKLEEREGEAQLELLEEKLKLAEAELTCALQRAERAETVSHQLSSKVNSLEEKLEQSCQAPPPPLPPPLPPPPPPPPMPSMCAQPPVTIRRRPSCDGAEAASIQSTSAVLEMANLLGIPRKTANQPSQPGAIDDIINQIKGGRFTLKSTEPKPRLQKVEEQPPVVQEMINVLGTLRKRRTPSMRRQLEKPPSDSPL
uniref:Uncharacterized protein n=1 Tax=Graphocephala atropunctata TaxID=36148 RepID=A0A1B6LBC4_9HEMI